VIPTLPLPARYSMRQPLRAVVRESCGDDEDAAVGVAPPVELRREGKEAVAVAVAGDEDAAFGAADG
jgi:hypothetical protein